MLILDNLLKLLVSLNSKLTKQQTLYIKFKKDAKVKNKKYFERKILKTRKIALFHFAFK